MRAFVCPAALPAPGYSGDARDAGRAGLSRPFDVAALPGGGFAMLDRENLVVRAVDAGGQISTLGRAGEDLERPATSVTALADGSVLVAEPASGRVLRHGPDRATQRLHGKQHAVLRPAGGAALSLRVIKLVPERPRARQTFESVVQLSAAASVVGRAGRRGERSARVTGSGARRVLRFPGGLPRGRHPLVVQARARSTDNCTQRTLTVS